MKCSPRASASSRPPAKRFGLSFTFDHFDWSCEHYAKHGRMMPDGGLDLIRKA